MSLLTSTNAFGSGLPTVRQITSAMGAYWNQVYQEYDLINALAYSLQQQVRQSNRQLHGFVDSFDLTRSDYLSYITVFPVRVPIAEFKRSTARFGSGLIFGKQVNARTPTFGEASREWWEFVCPPTLLQIAAVCDAPANPRHVFVNNADARLITADHKIELLVDDPLAVFKPTYDDPNTVTVWLYMAGFDDRRVQRQYGRFMSTQLPTSPMVTGATKAMHQSLISGASELLLKQYLAAACSCPVTAETETVEVVDTAKDKPLVITDKASYLGLPGALPAVAVADVLKPGTFLFDTVRFTDFQTGVPNWLTSLVLSGSYLQTKFPVTIAAGNLAMTYTQVSPSYIKIRFPVTAEGTAEDRFWTLFDQAAQAATPSLASRLAAINLKPVGLDREPDLTYLPANANVLDLFAKSWLNYGVSLSKIKTAKLPLGAGALLADVYKLLPAHTSHIIQFDGSTPPGYVEDVCTKL